MSEDSTESGDIDDLMPSVSDDRPLDSLMPEMRTLGGAGEGAPSQVPSVHPRVLEVGLESGSEWTLAIWGDDEAETADRVETLLRATLLMELSKPPTEELLARRFEAVRLLVFAELSEGTKEKFRQIGFDEVDFVPDQYEERMAAWRKEAAQADIQLPGAPASVWRLGIAHRNEADEDGAFIATTARTMTERLAEQPWGSSPGSVSRLLARRLEKQYDLDIGLDPKDFNAIAEKVVPQVDGDIRWVSPVIFQALCDYVGVLAHGAFDLEVQWGLCEKTDDGIVPPPTFRHVRNGEVEMIPVGRALLEWIIMPTPDESTLDRIPLSRQVSSLLEPMT